jgi:hypothetical protein
MPSAKSDNSAVRVIASKDGILVQDARGRAMPGVISVDIALRPGRPPVMRLNMVCGHFDVHSTPVFAVADPATGQPKPIRSIQFADGSVFEAPPLPDMLATPNGNGIDPTPPVDKPADAE